MMAPALGGSEVFVMPRHDVPPSHRANARRLRRSMTDAEKKLWARLRGHRLAEASFRRQVPIGPYIVDFFCAAARLVIEVDGGGHGKESGLVRDARRTVWLEDAGYRVLRFWNADVVNEIEAVLDAIVVALAEAGLTTTDLSLRGEPVPPLPGPPPPGGRESVGHGHSFPRESERDTSTVESQVAARNEPESFCERVAVVAPSPLEGEGQGGGDAGSPLATRATTTTHSSASKTGADT